VTSERSPTPKPPLDDAIELEPTHWMAAPADPKRRSVPSSSPIIRSTLAETPVPDRLLALLTQLDAKPSAKRVA
jgi:hypothetical protein